MNQISLKKWFRNCILSVVLVLFAIFALVWVVDPYFHFHKPFPFLKYRLYEERYINDGISRHFEYDAIITGTSMAQNYKVSELNELFDVNAVKMTFSGAGYKELSDNLDRALTRNPGVKKVFYSMDYNGFIRNKDWTEYENYPTYLYDDNPFNDVSYIYNKDILYHGVLINILKTIRGEDSTSLDEYSNFYRETGLEHILEYSERKSNMYTYLPYLSDYFVEIVEANINQNFIDLVNKHKDVEFYIFFPPYSICYWDQLYIDNMMLRQMQAELRATRMLLECPNIRLYNYNNQYDVITNLNNYSDKEHFTSEINSQILNWLATDTGRINKSNYMDRLTEEIAFYTNYDYDGIYK